MDFMVLLHKLDGVVSLPFPLFVIHLCISAAACMGELAGKTTPRQRNLIPLPFSDVLPMLVLPC